MESDDLHRSGILRQNKGKSYEKVLSQLSAVSHRQLKNKTQEAIPTLNSKCYLSWLFRGRTKSNVYLFIIDIMNNVYVDASVFQENHSDLFLSKQYQKRLFLFIGGEKSKCLMDCFLNSGACYYLT